MQNVEKKIYRHVGPLESTLLLLLSFFLHSYAIPDDSSKQTLVFANADIAMDEHGRSPIEIRFQEGTGIPVSAFFDEYSKYLGLSERTDTKFYRVFTDQLGQTHYRCKQYYKGVELAEVQFLLHARDNLVFYAHGKLIHGLNLDVVPILSEKEALESALEYINAKSYMWENGKSEAFIRREQSDTLATFYPKGELKLSAGNQEMISENFKLVFRFDVYAEEPLGRYFVDVDAKTGEIVNLISRINHGDVIGQGLSMYNGTVPIVVSDMNYPVPVPFPPHWHIDAWNAFGGTGESWWMADPLLGNEGGYRDNWYEVLDTEPILLSGTNLNLTFHHRYAVETPGGEPPGFDGWDGLNVRISTDGGQSWEILLNPTPAYSNMSLYSFGVTHGEGPNIPGWTGQLHEWTEVTFDLSAFAGQTVQFRFAFASDPGLSTSSGAPELFGWQIDDIVVSNSAETLYHMQNGFAYPLSTDFVDSDTIFNDANDRVGVSVHWASEACYDYYMSTHGRNSLDNSGGRMISYTHYANSFGNAFWDGNRATFGDGPENASPWVSLDMVGHEFTHGVTQYSAGLIYANESGALNESFSDVFGVLVEFSVEGPNGDWLIAEDFWFGGPALRSLENPRLMLDPDTYLGNYWVESSSDPSNENDFGGVHTNSGVQNHWFYLLSEGRSGVNDNGDEYAVTGIGKAEASKIAYRNLTVYLMPSSGYFDVRLASINSAIDLFGQGSAQYHAVLDAWFAVGVKRPFLEPAIATSSDSLSFVVEAPAEADTLELTVLNYGLDSLKISDIQISGSHFQPGTPLVFPIHLPNYLDSFTMTLIFRPDTQLAEIETLEILSNDPFNPARTVGLMGQVFSIRPAKEGVIYAITGAPSNGALITVDQYSGGGDLVGYTGFEELTDLAIRPSSGKLYGTVNATDYTHLIRIDAEEGDALKTINIPITPVNAIAFDLNDDLYAAKSNIQGELYLIDPLTGDVGLIGTTKIRLISSLAINPLDGQLWGISLTGDIYMIDKTSAAATLFGKSGINRTSEIEFDAAGKLFGLAGFNNDEGKLIQIDISSGIGILIGPTGFKGVYGLAIRGDVTVGVADRHSELLPARYALHQNHPNPFNPTTIIGYDLPQPSRVILQIYDMLGNEVKTLVDGWQSAGFKSKTWNGKNEQDQFVSSGVYVYRLQAGAFVQSKRMLFLK